MSDERLPGTFSVAQRIVNGEENFIETLMERGDMSRQDAEKVFVYYKKHGLVKTDKGCSYRYNVKVGSLLDRDVLQRAVSLVTSPSSIAPTSVRSRRRR